MEPSALMDKPFDRPVNLISLFPGQMNRRIIETINGIVAGRYQFLTKEWIAFKPLIRAFTWKPQACDV